jgi:hypothetical protein
MISKMKLTPVVFTVVRELVERGYKRIEIAEYLGVNEATLQVQACKRRISLRKGGRIHPSKPMRIRVREKTYAKLSRTAWRDYKAVASIRGIDPMELASRLLETIAAENLYDAVLDDDGKQTPPFLLEAPELAEA